jgi:electron transfer flavoprotein alpha subunit
MVETYRPEILLIGGTDFGLEFAPRVAKRLATGLSAECVALEIEPQEGIMIQTAPAFGGRLLADVATPRKRPQMVTVRPGTFRERPHDTTATAQVIYVDPVESSAEEPLEVLAVEEVRDPGEDLEDASIVISGGRGMGDAGAFRDLYRLAELLGGQVGGTRPAVVQEWIPEDRMIGQTGRTVRPKVLLTCGTSGALQYTVAIREAEFIIAINRDPQAPIFEHADLGIVGDACEIVQKLVETLASRRRKENVPHA